MLSVIGGAAGLATAALLLKLLNRWPPAAESHLDASVDARVYLAGLVLTLASALLFGMLPARHAWRSSPLQLTKSGVSSDKKLLRRFAMRDWLLGVQIAICTVLVTASFVSARGMLRTMHLPLGIKPQGAMVVDLDLNRPGQSADAVLETQREVIEVIQNLPGVTAVGTVNRMPMTGGIHGIPIFRPGTVDFKLTNAAFASYVFTMSPGYLNAAGTRLLVGRDLVWQDTAKTPDVAVVNETFARKMWSSDTQAIGQHFTVDGKLTRVVGVAEDGKYHDLTEAPQSAIYLPAFQNSQSEVNFVVRSRRPPREMAAALHKVLRGIQPNVPIAVQSWSDALDSVMLPARAATVASSAMGLLAAMLAVTGIFGMAAYGVSKRMRDLGIRMALGAQTPQVMTAAVGRPMIILGLGSLAGLTASGFAGQLLNQIVYRANPRDPIIICAAVLTMALLGLTAAAIPARRALSIDPSKIMRED